MRTLTMTLAVLTLTPSFASAAPCAACAVEPAPMRAPVRVSGSRDRGVGLITYGKGDRVISTMRQRPDGTQVKRERQTYFIDYVRHAAQVKTVTTPEGASTTTTHIYGKAPERTYNQVQYKRLTRTRAFAKALWANHITKSAVIAGATVLPVLGLTLPQGAYADAAIWGSGAAMFGGILGYIQALKGTFTPQSKVVHVETEKTMTFQFRPEPTTLHIPEKVTISYE